MGCVPNTIPLQFSASMALSACSLKQKRKKIEYVKRKIIYHQNHTAEDSKFPNNENVIKRRAVEIKNTIKISLPIQTPKGKCYLVR